MTKHYFTLVICCLLTSYQLIAQTELLTIAESYRLAKENYPASKQRELISKSMDLNIENASKGYYPQVSISGQATYQSEVTRIPIQLPGMNIPTISKDQYKLYGEVNQTLYDGGNIRNQKEMLETNAAAEEQKLEVELYKLKERINQLFFGILLIDEQLKQNELLKSDINNALRKFEAAYSNGTALKSNVNALKADLLKATQQTTELKANRKAYIEMLSFFINRPLDEQTVLAKPEPLSPGKDIQRPELTYYDLMGKSVELQNKTLTTKNLPKVSLFVQGGFGRPALNMLSNDFDAYYIGGLRMSIPLTGFYTLKKERSIVEINRQNVEVQKEIFLFNTQFTLKQQNAEIGKLQELMTSDNEIIELRSGIKNTALAQLENGVIQTSDYLREVNAEDNARQLKILHEIQLLLAQYNQQVTSGN